jgi:hypothetical protein
MGKSLSLLMRTSPYIIMRTVAYLIFGLINLVWLGIIISLIVTLVSLNVGGIAIFIVVAVGMGGFAGIVHLAERLVFFAIKAGHVAVITELLTKGGLPPGVNQVEFGKQAITTHFGTMAAFGVVDALVKGAVRQVLGWLTMTANLLSFIPGIETIWNFVRRVLSIAGNYIDEAVLSHTLAHPGQSGWKSAADGVVLYAQAWKKLISTAFLVVLVIIAIWVVGALSFFAIGLAIGSAIPSIASAGGTWVVGLVSGAIGGSIVRAILADPIAMVMMVTAYHDAVREMTPQIDLYGKLSGVSRKFRELNDKAQQPAPSPVP